MTRESSVVEMLVELADTLVDDFDVVELLTGLADRCVRLLGVSAAGVMLASPDGELRLMASSNEAMRILELFELQADEGPCLDAFRTGQRIEHENLRAGTGRWPRFSPAALEAGFGSVFALPLRLRHATIGALNLFACRGGPHGRRRRGRGPSLRRPGCHRHHPAPGRARDPAGQRTAHPAPWRAGS